MENIIKDQDHKREELLEELHGITFAAFLTDLVSEYCYELITLTSEGMTYQWIGYNDWNIYRLQSCSLEKWADIREKIRNGALTRSDIENTQFIKLMNCTIGSDETKELSKTFSRLLDMPSDLCDELYCYFDSDDRELCFAPNQEDLIKVLAEKYGSYADTEWSDMDTDDLENWAERYRDEGQDLPCVFFDEDN